MVIILAKVLILNDNIMVTPELTNEINPGVITMSVDFLKIAVLLAVIL